MRNKTKCIHIYIKLLYYGQQSLFLQRTPSCKWPQGKGNPVPLQAWSGPEGSRKLRFPDFMTTAQDGGKVVSLTHRPPLPPGNAPGTHFYYRLSQSRAIVQLEGFYVNEKFH
jgi:hypothetical protein